VIVDGGHLGMWSGNRSPAEIDPAAFGVDDPSVAARIVEAVDLPGRAACRSKERAAVSASGPAIVSPTAARALRRALPGTRPAGAARGGS
jgi:hypothetical protein